MPTKSNNTVRNVTIASLLAAAVASGLYFGTSGSPAVKPVVPSPSIDMPFDRSVIKVDPWNIDSVDLAIGGQAIDIKDEQFQITGRSDQIDDIVFRPILIPSANWSDAIAESSSIIQDVQDGGWTAAVDHRALPPYFVGCSTYDVALAATSHRERDLQLTIDGSIRIVRFGEGGDDEAAAEMIGQSDRPVLVVLMFDYLPDAFMDVAAMDVIAGVIVGHAMHADGDTVDFPAIARALNNRRSILQAVCPAPILLAVSITNAHDKDPPRISDSGRTFVRAFGDTIIDWDGFAIYNINRFPWFEFNSLDTIRRDLGIPDLPTVLFDLIGTNRDTPRARDIWRRKSFSLGPKIKREGWAGLILYSRFDAPAKAYAVEQMRRNTP